MSDNNNKTRLEENEEESESVNVLRNFVTIKDGKGNDTQLIKDRVTAILITGELIQPRLGKGLKKFY